ncbi:bifunctional diaminohydroxyphosphoribosylaminopyrimidine deaminase/5-amino-6-(5-phosphoribosylamino)uracil reductase RibD [Desulfuromonas sp. AOP6]|uniref:bifunctional diaminohydroxyphosphoribosylaminopyrimidine deaminase/5-amino-6-(5-phosphoribosylamino)uracil reductase RibD n=1 Tax=Desulfuromonas sp. AOP6 TaxID=1566351 RepID=UPI001CED412A|nr:bifunctional diaminohydroxyphosphoribosylaminopyrimidine deaminase/5-amino-6-(5-phosphoribosylamino)uracil reductase RibD [Desulfuromonas sp. AOP6]
MANPESPSPDYYMTRALILARTAEGRTRPNPAVGAVIVCSGMIVGEGFHRRAGEPHAEINALRQAGVQAQDGELYVTLEPCSHHGRTGPCAEAIVAAGIRKVFIGTRDPNPRVCGRGISLLADNGVEVVTGVLEEECRHLIAPFAKHVLTGTPLVTLKSAITLDGFCATSSGESQWISNEQSRLYVHQTRDKVDAVMVGIGTVLTDNPRLTTRLPEGGRNPIRVVVDTFLRIPEDSALVALSADEGTLVATTNAADPNKICRLQAVGVRVLVLPQKNGHVDLNALLLELGKMDIQHLFLEGGAILNGTLLREGLVDRAMIFVAPVLLGGDDGRGLFAGQGATRLVDAWRLKHVRVRSFGDDVLLEGEVYPCSPD